MLVSSAKLLWWSYGAPRAPSWTLTERVSHVEDSDLTNLFMLGRLRQGRRAEEIQLEQLNLLRQHQGLPPLELEPMISGAPATIFSWCAAIVIYGFVAMVALFVLAVAYIALHALAAALTG